MNWANRVTLIRLVLIPIIIIVMFLGPAKGYGWDVITTKFTSGNYSLSLTDLLAGILFILASLSDMLDGYIARKYNQVTSFGKFFDSIADKLLTNLLLVVFAVIGILPLWIVLIFIGRDFIIDVVRQLLASQKTIMSANNLGRYKAAIQMLGLSILFFVGLASWNDNGEWLYGEFGLINQIVMIPTYTAAILSVAAALNYMILNKEVLFSMSSDHGHGEKNE
ncbi:CDP-diacylglycerol-glycerol-3-phosphate 3-phosphatidyltransferase [Spiroplasma sp. TIUS-1]|uniref:CDP-diacylglycerol--glycerol-3-phosphate 3-phosphatidyltransferase n=1 Tax=Spiroplasma sp. TIUS-1 TaxID=216963 RepID=UPI0013983AAA|nr:CDP-diacylglycerol--glycerol-3-phosphate 3-phosphatidyltransferase [Spiroplasma sp. TIUS-1]QHX35683.1 CDP-diacylglycerol-glycerol-3-phosphate 3-phosphatidyltransferase [Spiroplasma sp. TIUS-1]